MRLIRYPPSAIIWGRPARGFGDQNGNVDIGAPKNFGQGYRWNVPVVYYAYDASFASFFGPYGMAEVRQGLCAFQQPEQCVEATAPVSPNSH